MASRESWEFDQCVLAECNLIEDEEMKKDNSKKTKKKDLQAGFALALMFFAISIFLFFQSEHYGDATKGIAIACIVLGFIGLGTELDNITSKKQKELAPYEKGTKIYGNIGVGIALLVTWVATFKKFELVWVNALLSPLLVLGMFGFMQGIVNLLFTIVPEQKQDKAIGKDKKNSLATAKKIITAISGILGFVASLLQILQYLKIIP
jgi:preprotein translocase subunit YajC